MQMSAKNSFNVAINEFFKEPVPSNIMDIVSIRDGAAESAKGDLFGTITSPPGNPGVPRPLWVVIVASVPTGLVWYGAFS